MTLNQVIKHFGDKMQAAWHLGVTMQTIKNWEKRIPWKTQKYIELYTNGSLKAVKPKNKS